MIEYFENYGEYIAVLFLIIYYIPILIGIKRRHQNIIGLGILNFFFGWTVIGWFAALIWSFSYNEVPSKEKAKQTTVGEELERLARLKNEGHLTQEEFKKEKKRLLQ